MKNLRQWEHSMCHLRTRDHSLVSLWMGSRTQHHCHLAAGTAMARPTSLSFTRKESGVQSLTSVHSLGWRAGFGVWRGSSLPQQGKQTCVNLEERLMRVSRSPRQVQVMKSNCYTIHVNEGAGVGGPTLVNLLPGPSSAHTGPHA